MTTAVVLVVTALALSCTSTDGTGSGPAGTTAATGPAGTSLTFTATGPASTSTLTYQPLDPRVFVQEHVIDAWIDRSSGADLPSIWNHAWDVWSALNQPTGQQLDGTPLPVWETWFSEGDVFLTREQVAGADSRDLDPPTQSIDAGDLAGNDPSANPATVLTFNRYNREIRDHVHQNRYYDLATITGMQNELDLSNAAPEDRTIAELPNTSVMLKPVWWIVPGDRASTMPYWAGETADVATDQRNPDWKTWKQCVVIDPTGSAPTDVDRTCNEGEAGQTPMPAGSYEVQHVSLDPATSDLYAFRLTADEVAGMQQFRTMLSNSNKEEKVDEVKAGDLALLVAMHVSTREITDWTWQTYWWTPHPQQVPPSPPNAQAPPASALTRAGVPKAFTRFQMCAAYFMTTPRVAGAQGQPFLCFNPYLETNLKGLRTADRTVTDDVGIHSNCMTCHIAAKKTPGAKPQYASNGFIPVSSPDWFGGGVRTQFLWSLASMAHPPPFVAPVPPKELPPAPTETPGPAGSTPPPG